MHIGKCTRHAAAWALALVVAVATSITLISTMAIAMTSSLACERMFTSGGVSVR